MVILRDFFAENLWDLTFTGNLRNYDHIRLGGGGVNLHFTPVSVSVKISLVNPANFFFLACWGWVGV